MEELKKELIEKFCHLQLTPDDREIVFVFNYGVTPYNILAFIEQNFVSKEQVKQSRLDAIEECIVKLNEIEKVVIETAIKAKENNYHPYTQGKAFGEAERIYSER